MSKFTKIVIATGMLLSGASACSPNIEEGSYIATQRTTLTTAFQSPQSKTCDIDEGTRVEVTGFDSVNLGSAGSIRVAVLKTTDPDCQSGFIISDSPTLGNLKKQP
ncbi:MAG: hypothetical protein NTU85_03745 [Candidatus Kaiserbacteria bacterium]|nr:hypothetical protein [Candidatus Kaiserbacteria bacterium]